MIYTGALCEVCEKGKIVINKCLDKGYAINTEKLEKLLILMQGTMLAKYNKPLFRQDVVAVDVGLVVKELSRQLLVYEEKIGKGFTENFGIYIALLQIEEQVMDEIIDKYGMLDFFELNSEEKIKRMVELCYTEGHKNIVPHELMRELFFYYKFNEFDVVRQKFENYQKTFKRSINNKNK